jgi:hypothetical protein
MAGSSCRGDSQAFWRDPNSKSQMRLRGRPKIRRPAVRPLRPAKSAGQQIEKIKKSPPAWIVSFAERIGYRSAYIPMIELVSSNRSPRLGSQDPVNRAAIIASASEPPLQFSDP